MATAPTLRKRERLVSRKLIETLFGGGSSQSMAVFPLRLVYHIKDCERARVDHQACGDSEARVCACGDSEARVCACGDAPAKLLVSVSKRHFRHAVDRNRVKRQIREAYRLNKHLLTDAVPGGSQVLVAILWLSDDHLPSCEVEKRVVKLLQRLAERLQRITEERTPEQAADRAPEQTAERTPGQAAEDSSV